MACPKWSCSQNAAPWASSTEQISSEYQLALRNSTAYRSPLRGSFSSHRLAGSPLG